VGATLFVLPLAGLAARAPWPHLPQLVTSDVVVDALRLSLLTSLTAAAISLLLGVPLAWLLARVEFPGRHLLRAIVTLPMFFASVSTGCLAFVDPAPASS
jgi:molybdate transport system permease protein